MKTLAQGFGFRPEAPFFRGARGVLYKVGIEATTCFLGGLGMHIALSRRGSIQTEGLWV